MLDRLLRAGEPPALAMTLHEDGAFVGAVLRREDRGLLVSGLPLRHATAIAEALAGTELPGVVGPVAEAEAFADVWTAPVCHRFDQRLFALGALTPPGGCRASRHRGRDDQCALPAAGLPLPARRRDAGVRRPS